MAYDAQALYATLQERGLTAPLDTPENQQNLQAALAHANGVPAEQALEWLAKQFDLLPVRTQRPSISVQVESAFRQFAQTQRSPEDEPWLPIGLIGPLIICGHYNPWYPPP